ncbi:polysaccharide biosynthesis/export family protein [Flavobacterium orientale]|nr:polysaccharide biosynthesis/export family protein [Flavobacterium orientale]
MRNSKSLLLLFILGVMTSCVSKKSVVYFPDIDTATLNGAIDYEPKIKVDDMLYIAISAADPKAAEPFNLNSGDVTIGGGGGQGLQVQRQTYLVSNLGTVDFPVLGSVKIAGLTKAQLSELLKEKLVVYMKDPVLNIRFMNYKLAVLGEVNRPGTYTLLSDRTTILEAVAMAGDLTLFGKRENVLVLREEEGVKTAVRLDLTSADIINSPYYYLSQNDVVYVEPNKRRINSTAIGPNILAGISILGFAITTILLLTK